MGKMSKTIKNRKAVNGIGGKKAEEKLMNSLGGSLAQVDGILELFESRHERLIPEYQEGKIKEDCSIYVLHPEPQMIEETLMSLMLSGAMEKLGEADYWLGCSLFGYFDSDPDTITDEYSFLISCKSLDTDFVTTFYEHLNEKNLFDDKSVWLPEFDKWMKSTLLDLVQQFSTEIQEPPTFDSGVMMYQLTLPLIETMGHGLEFVKPFHKQFRNRNNPDFEPQGACSKWNSKTIFCLPCNDPRIKEAA